MNVKTDTKEKFTVITPLNEYISANMTAEVKKLDAYGTNDIPHIVINFSAVKQIDAAIVNEFAVLQQGFYERNHSCVFCCINDVVETAFADEDLLDVINYTPTESEAWDILQMEEIERELMGDE